MTPPPDGPGDAIQFPSGAPPVLAVVVRDGVVESVHRGHVAVSSPDGRLLAAVGDAGVEVYPRSALKPFQALATLQLLAEAGLDAALDDAGLAIACASHTGTAWQQIEAALLLALAGVDESALQCPPAWPSDVDAVREQEAPDPLAHNCSGKHAGFIWAQRAAGGDVAAYLDADSAVQQRVVACLAAVAGAEPRGPGVDGCGAPAWRLPLEGVATSFARLAAAPAEAAPPSGVAPVVGLARVAGAMRRHAALVGGVDAEDTLLMLADPRVVAKRGAEAVLGAAVDLGQRGAVGVAVKIADGGQRAAAPVAAAVLSALGAAVPDALVVPAVLGGGRPHGAILVAPEVTAALRGAG